MEQKNKYSEYLSFEEMLCPIVIVTPQKDKFVIEYVNSSFRKMLAAEPEQLIGIGVSNLLKDFFREKKLLFSLEMAVEQIHYALEVSSRQQTLQIVEGFIWNEEGNRYPDQLLCIPFKKDQDVKVLLVFTHLGNENFYSSTVKSYIDLFNTVTDAIYIQDENGYFLDVNKGALKMYGYNREEFIGRTPEFLSAPGKNDLKKLAEDIKRAFKGEKVSFEFWGQRKNGEIFPKEVILHKGKYFDKDVIIATARDITERKNYEQKILEINQQLKEMSLAKDKFFSIIAHDLRSPFHGLLGFSEIILNEIDKLSREEIKEYSKYINSLSKKMYELVDKLLQWSQIQTGKIEYSPAKVNISQLIKSILELFQTNISLKRINLTMLLPEELTVFADAQMIQSVFSNLISNAIKYTKPGGLIYITSEAEDNTIAISITDTGVGMDKDDIDKLFRIDKTFTTPGTNDEQGSGLGLLITKELVEKNHGKIKVSSQKGTGTTFTIILPKEPKE
ncbi:MAG: ATP-binding protein [Ignavibacteria bacterium]